MINRIIGLSTAAIGYCLTGYFSAPLAIPGYFLYAFGLTKLLIGG
jgi:hypothetical protein